MYLYGGLLGSHGVENQEAVVRPEIGVFDRNPDPALDELIELAAVLCNADYGYIGWMDFNRLWFKARFGFKATEQPRASTACQWMLEKGEPMLIADASRGSAFSARGHSAAGRQSLPFLRGSSTISAATNRSIGTMAVLSQQAGPIQAGASDAA